MALIDSRTLFAEAFDLSEEAGTYLFTNQIDLGAANIDVGDGQPVYLNILVTETFTDGGDSATLNLRLRSDDTATTHATTSTAHFETGTMLKALLVAGETMSFTLPAGSFRDYERYLGLQGVVATAGFDAGKITAWLSRDPHKRAGISTFPDATN